MCYSIRDDGGWALESIGKQAHVGSPSERNESGATDSKEPLPAEAFRNILLLTVGTPLGVRATALAIVVAFFFLLRISEVAKRGKHHKEEFIAQIRDVTFFCKSRLWSWNHPGVDAVELFIRGSKTDQRKQGCRRMQQATGDPVLCPVLCLSGRVVCTHGGIPHTFH